MKMHHLLSTYLFSAVLIFSFFILSVGSIAAPFIATNLNGGSLSQALHANVNPSSEEIVFNVALPMENDTGLINHEITRMDTNYDDGKREILRHFVPQNDTTLPEAMSRQAVRQ